MKRSLTPPGRGTSTFSALPHLCGSQRTSTIAAEYIQQFKRKRPQNMQPVTGSISPVSTLPKNKRPSGITRELPPAYLLGNNHTGAAHQPPAKIPPLVEPVPTRPTVTAGSGFHSRSKWSAQPFIAR